MPRSVTLIVEDGTIVENANSFVSEDQIVSYAAERGVTLPFASDEEKDAVAILGIKSTDYLNAVKWRGDVVEADQPMPWPRKNLNVTPSFPENVVPSSVVKAQLQLSLLSKDGTVLVPSHLGTGLLTKEKIGPIENVYSTEALVSTDGLPIFPGVTNLLRPWLLGDFEGFTFVGITSIGGC